MKKVLALIGLLISSNSFAETGPVSDKLNVQYMYTHGSLYVRFNNGSMPGCHGNNSGRLYDTNSRFDEIYAQLLTMIAMGGIKGQVIYKINNPGAGQWSDCEISGLILHP